MKKGVFYLLCLLILIGCQTPTAREIARYVGRPEFEPACIMNGDGTCYKDGELLDSTNMLGAPPKEFEQLQRHLESVEKRLYICLKYKRKYCK